MYISKSKFNIIKYIFFLQILYCNVLNANNTDLRANPEIGKRIIGETSISYANEYMIVCADKRAAIAAKNILIKGGNAIDAAIAAQNVLSVVEPQSSGLGGGGFLIYYNANTNSIEAWDGREFSPSSSSPKQYYDLNDNKLPFLEALVNPISIGVPGLYSMLADAHAENGSINWETLFTSSINHAKSFKVSPRLNKMLRWAPHIKSNINVKKIYFDGDLPKNIGAEIKNLELAQSLQIISKDPYSINNGKISNLIDRKLFPILNKKDLNSWTTNKRKPICKKYKEFKVCGFPPPTSGGVTVLQILGILENFDTSFNPLETELDEHLFLEASKLAYADRSVYIADPRFFSVPTEALLKKEYLKDRSKLINTKKASRDVRFGKPKNFTSSNLSSGINFNLPSTTHISIVDKFGNAVSLTSSIEFAFGSGMLVGGFFLNNQLTDFSFVSEKETGEKIANSVEPYKKPRSSMAPTLVFKDNNLIGVLGSPGGSRIICYVAQTLFYLINFNMKLEDVMELPHLCAREKASEIENISSGDFAAKKLSLMEHYITRKEMTSGLNIIWKQNDFWVGASDRRREGVAFGEKNSN